MKFWQIYLIFIAVDFIIALAGGLGVALVCGVVFAIAWFIYGEIKQINAGRRAQEELEAERQKRMEEMRAHEQKKEKIKDYWGTMD